MALTPAITGYLNLNAHARVALSGDGSGSITYEDPISYQMGSGSNPSLAGVLAGTLSVTGAQDILLAAASDPLGATGDAGYSEGYDPDGDELILLMIRNTHATASLKVERGAANGLPIFDAAGEGLNIAAGGIFFYYDPAGTGALTTTSNDKLTLTPSTGTVTAELLAWYKAV